MPRPPAPGRLVARLLDEAADPIYALDAKRQIVFVNRALSDWLGVNSDELLGRRCDYEAASGNDPLAAVCAALCPPPEAFAGSATDGAISRLARVSCRLSDVLPVLCMWQVSTPQTGS